MIELSLQMRYSEEPQREAEAWLIADSDPEAWISAIVTSGCQQTVARILPLPTSRQDRRPVGALVFFEDRAGCNTLEAQPAYGRIGQLLLPVEATLDPDISDGELRRLLPANTPYVWHPIVGLIAFESDDVLRLSDLLTVGDRRDADWDQAQPGIAIAPRLTQLVPEATPTIEAILSEGQGDIGESAEELGELPPSPHEPRPGMIGGITRAGKRLAANVVQWLTNLAPGGAEKRTWLDRASDWASSQLNQLSAEDYAKRNKELARLMHLLETNPDEGLRFALPIGGDNQHRGLAPPSSSLSRQSTDFNLSRLAGGHAADAWDMTNEYYQRLEQSYRELANREMRLGRHRRAAYIFASLLSDYNAAANALMAGCHWREAAVLFRDKLNRPYDAANCLRQGGLHAEAIALYEHLERFETVGDIYLELDQREEAIAAFRREVSKRQSVNEPLQAAQLLEEKVGAVDEALDVLWEAWPNSPQGTMCLRRYLAVLARLGRHEQTIDRLKELRHSLLSDAASLDLATILSETATSHPDRLVRQQADRLTKEVVAREIQLAPYGQAQRLVSALTALTPDDRLLVRDGQRFLHGDPRPPPHSATDRSRLRVVHRMRITGPEVAWKAAAVSHETIVVAGNRKNWLFVRRASWQAIEDASRGWSQKAHFADDWPVLLAADPVSDEFVIAHQIGAELLTSPQTFEATSIIDHPTSIGAPAGMSEGVLAVAQSSNGLIWLLESRDGSFVLLGLSPDGNLLHTHSLCAGPASLRDLPLLPFAIHARGEQVFVAIERNLWRRRGSVEQLLEFDQPIIRICGSIPNSRTRIAVAFEQGGEMFWGEAESNRSRFAHELDSPLIAFNRGGYLIAASNGVCQVYATQSQQLRLEAELTDFVQHPIALLSGPQSNQFGVVTAQGEILVYEFP